MPCIQWPQQIRRFQAGQPGGCLEGEEQGVEDEPEELGRLLVALLLTPREDNANQPGVGQIRLIVCSGEEAPKQIDFRDVQLL